MSKYLAVRLLSVIACGVLTACSVAGDTGAVKPDETTCCALDAQHVIKPNDLARVMTSMYLTAVSRGDIDRYARLTDSTITEEDLTALRQNLFGRAGPFELAGLWNTQSVQQTDAGLVYQPIAELPDERLVGIDVTVSQHYPIQTACCVMQAQTRALTAADTKKVAAEVKRIKDKAGQRLDTIVVKKPVIYLYPEQPAQVRVQLDLDGAITHSEPVYDESSSGWSVLAFPSGRLIHNGSEYPYLFWEADLTMSEEWNDGFVVASEDVESFLARKLIQLGLNESEGAEFIEYWSPRMRRYPYCLVRFAGAEYEQAARLSVTPTPDTLIRVFMVYRSLETPIAIAEQRLSAAPQRSGFVLVEWGGSELDTSNSSFH